MKAKPKVTTVGELLKAVQAGHRQVAVPAPGDKRPRSKSFDFDGLMRRINKRYRAGLSEATLREAVADVAAHRDCPLGDVRHMTFGQFNSVLDEVMGQRRYGPDARRQILWRNGEPYKLSPKNWEFLCVVWGRYNVPFADIGEALWGDDAAPGNRIRQLVSRLDRQLSKHKIVLTLISDRERVSPAEDWPE